MEAGNTSVEPGVVAALSSLFLAWVFIICWFVCERSCLRSEFNSILGCYFCKSLCWVGSTPYLPSVTCANVF